MLQEMPQKWRPDTLLSISLRCLALNIDLLCYGAREAVQNIQKCETLKHSKHVKQENFQSTFKI
jgi:hypothetical protein